jgi:hypothetical protein
MIGLLQSLDRGQQKLRLWADTAIDINKERTREYTEGINKLSQPKFNQQLNHKLSVVVVNCPS